MRITRTYVLSLIVLLAALAAPAVAPAAVDTFHRFEVDATANYVVTEQCDDGTASQLFVSVIGGHEEETASGETTADDFLTVRIFGRDCTGNFLSLFATGPAEFTFSPSLQTASVTGTVTTRTGSVITVDMRWEGTSEIDVNDNVTTFPGFVGHFQSKERAATATGTVTLDGETLVSGSTTNASIETLEDTNIRTGT